MVTILIHTRNRVGGQWKNHKMEFSRIPCAGEYLVSGAKSDWYQVHVVVHCPFEGADFDAEIYAEKVNHFDVIFPRRPMSRKKAWEEFVR